MLAVPATPYRGIRPFRYADHAIFFAREEESRRLASLVAVYRGVLLYGDSGAGKSSLINAGLLPEVAGLGFRAERVRVQPRAGEELVIQRIAVADDEHELLPSVLAPDERARRIVMSAETVAERVRTACAEHRPLLIFDQFEELVTLFEEAHARDAQQRVAELIAELFHTPLPVKLLFSFREDYLGRIKALLGACPELIDQALRLEPARADALPAIVRGPFERHPGHFQRELSPALARRLEEALADRFGAGEVSLTEVQTVCLRLWQAPDPEALLAARGVRGVLEDYLGEALDVLGKQDRAAAVAVLGQMVTSAGTRNVIAADDLVRRVRDDDPDMPPERIEAALERLERESRLVRRERRRDLYLYELTSEFLVPWISRRRDELQRMQERRRERRRLLRVAALLVLIIAIVAALGAVAQRNAARADKQKAVAEQKADEARSLALASAADTMRAARPDLAMILAFEALGMKDQPQARSSMLAALETARTRRLLRILHGHSDQVLDVAFAPGGRTLASASADGDVRLWDPRSGRPQGPILRGHDGPASEVAFSPVGGLAASSGNDGTVRLWNTRTGTSRIVGRQAKRVNAVAFSRDGTLASGGADEKVRIWRPPSYRHPLVLARHIGSVRAVAFSADGTLLASASADKKVRVWDVGTGTPVGQPVEHEKAVSAVAFGTGDTLASGSADSEVRVWHARAGAEIKVLEGHDGPVSAVAFSPDGRRLASGGADRTVRIWDPDTDEQLAVLRGHSGQVRGVAFGPGGRTVASASTDKTIRIWSLRPAASPGMRLLVSTEPVAGVAFSANGRMFAAAGPGHTIGLLALDGGGPRSLPGHAGTVRAVAFRPDGRMLASASDGDTAVQRWDVRTGAPLPALRGHTSAVSAVAFSRDGKTLASGSEDGTIRLWDARTGAPHGVRPWPAGTGARRGVLGGHTARVTSVAFSPDGRRLASASDDKTIRLWDLRTGAAPKVLDGHRSRVRAVAFGRRGSTLASGGYDNRVRLWDARTGKELKPPLDGHGDYVNGVAVGPDSRTVASVSDDGTLRLWDVRSHTALGLALRGGAGALDGVAISPDGRTLAVGGHGGVRAWPNLLWRDRDELRREVCGLVGTGLSEAEWRQVAPGIPFRRTCP